MPLRCVLGCILACTSLAGSAGAQDEPVFKQITAEQTETLLRALKIDFKKTRARQGDTLYYDVHRRGRDVRLYWYGGKDLMLDVLFPKLPLERINEWNVGAKFSRACLRKDSKGAFTALEANLDVRGGITQGTVKQFLQVFDEEITAFARFAGIDPGEKEVIYTKLTSDKLEAILKGLDIKATKTDRKDGVSTYQFQWGSHQIRLTTFAGEDLMLDVHFKKLPLQAVNQYNRTRKFIRCVAYNVAGKEYTALECNLDCVGGVSDSIVRHFLRSFEEEVSEFAKYVQGK